MNKKNKNNFESNKEPEGSNASGLSKDVITKIEQILDTPQKRLNFSLALDLYSPLFRSNQGYAQRYCLKIYGGPPPSLKEAAVFFRKIAKSQHEWAKQHLQEKNRDDINLPPYAGVAPNIDIYNAIEKWIYNENHKTVKNIIKKCIRINLDRLGLYDCRLRHLPLATLLAEEDIGDYLRTQMTELVVYRNDLQELPVELIELQKLNSINISRCSLPGPIPDCLMGLTNLRWLWLSGNRLSGPIPPELGQLKNLQSIDFTNNRLTGCIPLELCQLAQLSSLYLDANQLSGAIPAALGNLSKLDTLVLKKNKLSGPIPGELEQLDNLRLLDLGTNQLCGSIPKGLGNLSKLKQLLLRNNQLKGTIPHELTQLPELAVLDLAWNQLVGTIHDDFAKLSKLRDLDLTHNQLSGKIPLDLAYLPKLTLLYLSYNNLSTPIPGAFFKYYGEAPFEGQGGTLTDEQPNVTKYRHRI